MSQAELLRKKFEVTGGDFLSAGQVSSKIKKLIRQLGLPSNIIKRVSIACYEAEMNIVVYAHSGTITLVVTAESINLKFRDKGPGIESIELAMQEGYSTATDSVREMGFGAGMGLPNIQRNADKFSLKSKVGFGTDLSIVVFTGISKDRAA